MTRTRRLKSSNNFKFHCRRCQLDKKETDFYEATNKILDTNGRMSVCKQCINELFDNIYNVEHNLEKTVLQLCKMLDILYSPIALEAAKSHFETLQNRNGADADIKFYGLYKSKLHNVSGDQIDKRDEDINLTYQDNPTITISSDNPLDQDEFEEAKDLIQFWGIEDKDDLTFLEREYANLKKSYRGDTYAEQILFKEICYSILDIHKTRLKGGSTDKQSKALQNMMKTSGIAPYQENEAGSGKSVDSFGEWIKNIENTTPAEFFKDKDIYKDVDNIEEYTERYIISPLRNFVTGSRDFKMDSSMNNEETEELEEAVNTED